MTSGGLKAKIPTYALLPAVLSLFIFINAIGNDFTYDDEISIRQNQCIQDAPLSRLLKSDIWCIEGAQSTGSYRPLTLLLDRAVYRLFGLEPAAFRMLNIAGYILCVFMATLLARRFLPDRRSAMLAGLFFAAHPIHSEAVNYISAFSETGSCFFALLAVYTYSFASEPKQSWIMRFVSLILVFAGMLMKESAVTVLGVFFIMDLHACLSRDSDEGLDGRCRGRAAGVFVFYLISIAVVSAYILLRICLFESFSSIVKPEDNPIAGQSWDVYYGTAFSAIAEYLRLLVFPLNLSVEYSFNQIPLISLMENPLLVWPGVLMLLSTIAALFLIKRNYLFSFGILFFWITFSIASNLLISIPTLVAERQMLLPSFGLCLIVGGLAGRAALMLSRNARAFLWAGVVILLILGIWRTVMRNIDWSSNMALFDSAVKVTPNSYKARKNLGYWYRKAAHYDLALEQYRAAQKIS